MRVKKGGKTYDRGKRLHQEKGRKCETPQQGNYHTKGSDSDAEDKWLKYREFPNDTGRDMFASSSSGSSSEMSAFDKLLANDPIHIPCLRLQTVPLSQICGHISSSSDSSGHSLSDSSLGFFASPKPRQGASPTRTKAIPASSNDHITQGYCLRSTKSSSAATPDISGAEWAPNSSRIEALGHEVFLIRPSSGEEVTGTKFVELEQPSRTHSPRSSNWQCRRARSTSPAKNQEDTFGVSNNKSSINKRSRKLSSKPATQLSASERWPRSQKSLPTKTSDIQASVSNSNGIQSSVDDYHDVGSFLSHSQSVEEKCSLPTSSTPFPNLNFQQGPHLFMSGVTPVPASVVPFSTLRLDLHPNRSKTASTTPRFEVECKITTRGKRRTRLYHEYQQENACPFNPCSDDLQVLMEGMINLNLGPLTNVSKESQSNKPSQENIISVSENILPQVLSFKGECNDAQCIAGRSSEVNTLQEAGQAFPHPSASVYNPLSLDSKQRIGCIEMNGLNPEQLPVMDNQEVHDTESINLREKKIDIDGEVLASMPNRVSEPSDCANVSYTNVEDESSPEHLCHGILQPVQKAPCAFPEGNADGGKAIEVQCPEQKKSLMFMSQELCDVECVPKDCMTDLTWKDPNAKDELFQGCHIQEHMFIYNGYGAFPKETANESGAKRNKEESKNLENAGNVLTVMNGIASSDEPSKLKRKFNSYVTGDYSTIPKFQERRTLFVSAPEKIECDYQKSIIDICSYNDGKPMRFSKFVRKMNVERSSKLGEGVYGEVYRLPEGSVLKVIPVGREAQLEPYLQTSFEDIYSELIIAR
ncbi:unnamed protein product [Darwinula stevensoni]|uniref:Uncharacterized protein n=1 Tax=Darwinula stevensoni TaxID=69355 RepID=A0A7R9ABG4_9CRUS|nr:unnamed protein product [Darwinula stevensoni]CAG0899386.1 unnamed protein product [Darwinula stevensoni]